MQHVLRFQLLHQPVGDQLVVVRSLQIIGERFESHQEARKILVLIKRFGFGDCAVSPMPLAQFDERLRRNRAFEMQVQLGFRQGADERRAHGSDCRVRSGDWRTSSACANNSVHTLERYGQDPGVDH